MHHGQSLFYELNEETKPYEYPKYFVRKMKRKCISLMAFLMPWQEKHLRFVDKFGGLTVKLAREGIWTNILMEIVYD